MAQLLRLLNSPDKWAELSESPLWAAGDCPSQLLEEVIGSEGISLYEVDSEDDIYRVAAAATVSWGTFKACSFALIPSASLKKIHITPRNTKGETFDDKTNDLHRDVLGISGKQLIDFVRTIVDDGDIRIISKEDLTKKIKKALEVGDFDRGKIFKKEKALGALKQLWNEKIVDIITT